MSEIAIIFSNEYAVHVEYGMVQVALDMANAMFERLKAKHGEESLALEPVRMTTGACNLHKDIIEKWGRFPHRYPCNSSELVPFKDMH